MRKNVTLSGVLLALSLIAGQVFAIPISGSVGFAWNWEPVGGTGVADATGVDILGDTAMSLGGSGHLSPLVVGTLVSFSDFDFDPALSPIPADPLWHVDLGTTTYSFTLRTIAVDTRSPTTLGLYGTGTLSVTGLDDTRGVFSWSGDTSAGSTFRWSADTSAAAVPEPSTVALMGIGLVFVGLARRRRLAG